MNARVSVAMASFNGEAFISAQLASLARQTLPPCELVVTDDGSADRTLAILDGFALTAKFPVHIHRNATRLGYAANFLHAASLCTGDLIAFCDQDDVWAERKLEICAAEFADDAVLLCVHSAKIWGRGERRDRRWPDFRRREILPPNTADVLTTYPGFSMVLRKSLLTILDHPERRPAVNIVPAGRHPMTHDKWVWFLAAIFGSTICLPDPLVLYRQHANNVFGAQPDASASQRLASGLVIRDYRKLAEDCLIHAAFLEGMAPLLADELASRALDAAQNLRRRARLRLLRAAIYGTAAGPLRRAGAFIKILAAGGYWPDAAQIRFGPKAALKDSLLGLPGIFKTWHNSR